MQTIDELVPLNPNRQTKPPTLKESDTSINIRHKLGRYLLGNLNPNTDHQQLIEKNINTWYPTLQPVDSVGIPTVDDYINNIRTHTTQPLYIYLHTEPYVLGNTTAVEVIIDGYHQITKNKIGLVFLDTPIQNSATSLNIYNLSDLLAAQTIMHQMSMIQNLSYYLNNGNLSLREAILSDSQNWITRILTLRYYPFDLNLINQFESESNIKLPPFPDERHQAADWAMTVEATIRTMDDKTIPSRRLILSRLNHYFWDLMHLSDSDWYLEAVQNFLCQEQLQYATRS